MFLIVIVGNLETSDKLPPKGQEELRESTSNDRHGADPPLEPTGAPWEPSTPCSKRGGGGGSATDDQPTSLAPPTAKSKGIVESGHHRQPAPPRAA
jgi:hypothetical protein